MVVLWGNGPEYESRAKKPFRPPNITIKDVHDAVPKDLLQKNHSKSVYYILRDITICAFLYTCAYRITPFVDQYGQDIFKFKYGNLVLKAGLWSTYWVMQGLVFAGIFCLGHDAGHGSLFESKTVNNTVGFILHSYLLIPFFSWRSTHHAHHKATGSMERDENYVPHLRSKFNLPEEDKATAVDYTEAFEETPIYTLFTMLIMQGFGWWLYLTQNTLGNIPNVSHFNPYSPLFRKEQRLSIVLSDIGLALMVLTLYYAGLEFFLWYYLVPYLGVNHWIVMFTYLHHSDPTIPHYRKGEWSFLRGAVATVDRPLLGWFGRFFFHNISHDHVAHHFFLRAPFYNGPEITKHVKEVLKEDYNYDSTPSFYALYRSFTQCLFVEEAGDIIFYKNGKGKAARELDKAVLNKST